MLVELQIRNLAIIDRLEVGFGPGLNVITGETGAGKSIVLDALQLALGARASADVIRSGCDAARVEAVFDLEGARTAPEVLGLLEGAGVEAEDRCLVLGREVQATGRSVARVNGHMVPASLLQSVGRLLVDIHGQGDHQLLLSPQHQLRLLDRFAGLVQEVDRLSGLVERIRSLQELIRREEQLLAHRDHERDFLQFQLREIESLAPSPGEDEALAAERRVLANAEALLEGADEIYTYLHGEAGEGVLDRLGRAAKRLLDLAKLDPTLQAEYAALDSILAEAEELTRRIRSYRDRIEVDPERLSAVDARLDALNRLKRKYGGSLEAVLREAEHLRAKLAELESAEASMEGLRSELNEVVSEALPLALGLSQRRRSAAEALSGQVTSLLPEVGMPGGGFVVSVKPRVGEGSASGDQLRALGSWGLDEVEYLVSLNPGEPAKPLAKVASGGEMARLMLAIKSVLSQADDTPCLVFDEIDVGVGGRGGGAVGRRLWRLSLRRQVICVTHLPQVAAFADRHIVVTKGERDGRTAVAVASVDGDARVHELAAMLAGPAPSASAVASALDIIAEASRYKAVEGSGVYG